MAIVLHPDRSVVITIKSYGLDEPGQKYWSWSSGRRLHR